MSYSSEQPFRRRRSGIGPWACGALALILAACTAGRSPPLPSLGEMPSPAKHYILGPGDRLRIVVFGQPELSGEFSVNTDGSVSYPLVGAVPGAGYTPAALEAAIVDALSPDYLREPQVSVEVLSYRPYFIMGEVKAPGSYPYMNGLDVLSAIAVAGGYTYRAKKTFVFLTRRQEGKKERREVSPNTAILPGDIIEVPERFF